MREFKGKGAVAQLGERVVRNDIYSLLQQLDINYMASHRPSLIPNP